MLSPFSISVLLLLGNFLSFLLLFFPLFIAYSFFFSISPPFHRSFLSLVLFFSFTHTSRILTFLSQLSPSLWFHPRLNIHISSFFLLLTTCVSLKSSSTAESPREPPLSLPLIFSIHPFFIPILLHPPIAPHLSPFFPSLPSSTSYPLLVLRGSISHSSSSLSPCFLPFYQLSLLPLSPVHRRS